MNYLPVTRQYQVKSAHRENGPLMLTKSAPNSEKADH